MQTKSPIKKQKLTSVLPLTKMRTRSYTRKYLISQVPTELEQSSEEASTESIQKTSLVVDNTVKANHTFNEKVSKEVKVDDKRDSPSPVRSEIETGFKNCSNKKARLAKCVLCNRMTRTSSKNKHHPVVESNDSSMCSNCATGNEIESNEQQISLKNVKMEDTAIKCSVCSKYFNNEDDLLSHRTSSKECSICSEQFCTVADLNHHKRRKHSIRYSCSYCSKTTPYLKNYLRHLDQHAKTGIAVTCVCAYCSESFDSSELLRNHNQIHKIVHTPTIPCPWKHCSKKFTSQKRLDQHVKRHNGEKVYLCSRCGMLLTDCILYKKHRSTCRQRYIKLTCKMCGKECGGYSALKTHVRTHTGEKPYECDTCGMHFKINHHLKRHKLIHLRNGKKRLSQNCSTQTPLKMGKQLSQVIKIEPAEKTLMTSEIQNKEHDGYGETQVYTVIKVKSEPVIYYISTD